MNHHATPVTGPGSPAAKRRGARPGTALVLIAGGMTLLMASAAWVVDLAAGLQSRTAQQAATDAAALAGAMELVPPYTAAKGDLAKAKAVEFAGLNGAPITTDDVEIWDHPAGGKAITVRSNQAVDTFFARVFQINAIDVGTNSSCALGGVTQVPHGTLPFGVPAYEEGDDWRVLGGVDPTETYVLCTNPPPPSPTGITIQLKVSSGSGGGGNFMPLALDGSGANEYREDIREGCTTPVQVGDVVETQTGNMVGPTSQGIQTRIGDTVVVPLIDKAEWDENTGHSEVTIVGFMSVIVRAGANPGEVLGEYVGYATSAPGVIGSTGSAGVMAPVLIETP